MIGAGMKKQLTVYSEIINQRAQALYKRSDQENTEQQQGVSAICERAATIEEMLQTLDTVPLSEIRIVKHNLRNMLTPVLGYSQLISTERLGSIDTQMYLDCSIIIGCVRGIYTVLDEWVDEKTATAI